MTDTISEKLQRIAENVQKVYEAGKAAGGGSAVAPEPLFYATSLSSVYKQATFPENHSLVIKVKKMPAEFYQAFYQATGLKGVKLVSEDRSALFALNQAFRECASLEEVDLTECSRNVSRLDYAFYSTGVKRIKGALDLTEGTTTNYGFVGANLLEDIEFVPNTISVDIRFSSAVLTDASINSIIDGLADLTGATAQTLTLHATVGAALTDEQKAMISAKNWTLAY